MIATIPRLAALIVLLALIRTGPGAVTAQQEVDTDIVRVYVHGKCGDASGDTLAIQREVDRLRISTHDGAAWVEQQVLDIPIYQVFDLDGDRIAAAGQDRTRVYRRTDGSWSLEEELPIASSAVRLVGETLLLADPDSGVQLWERSGGGWQAVTRLRDRGGLTGYGIAALDWCGNVLVVGNYSADEVYVYVERNGIWRLVQTLEEPAASQAHFGKSVAINGTTIFVSHSYEIGTASNNTEGSVYVYDLAELWRWEQSDRITNDDYPGSLPSAKTDAFGSTFVADGDRLTISSSFNDLDDDGDRDGAFYVYEAIDGTWQRRLKVDEGTDQTVFAFRLAGSGDVIVSADRGDRDEQAFVHRLSRDASGAAAIAVNHAGHAIPDGAAATTARGTDFGPVRVGRDRRCAVFALRNPGAAPVSLASPPISLSGDAAADFTVLRAPLCDAIRPGGMVSFVLCFTPQAPGTRNATVHIDATGGVADHAFAVTGVGEAAPAQGSIGVIGDLVIADGAPVDATSEAGVHFGNVNLGEARPLAYTIVNSGGLALELSAGVTITGPAADQFVVSEQPAPLVGAGGDTTFVVRYTPDGDLDEEETSRLDEARIEITSNDPDIPVFDFGISGRARDGASKPQIVLDPHVVTVDEGGSHAVSVRLASAPSSEVVLRVDRIRGDGDITVTTGDDLVFDAGDWDTPQTITVHAADDADVVAGQTLFAVSNGGYGAVALLAVEADDDAGVSRTIELRARSNGSTLDTRAVLTPGGILSEPGDGEHRFELAYSTIDVRIALQQAVAAWIGEAVAALRR